MAKSKSKLINIPTTNDGLLDTNNFYLPDYTDPFNLPLIYEFLTVQFNNNSVIYNVRKNLPKLLETGNLEYLYKILNHEPIFQEETFWKQILDWKKVIFDGEFPHVRHKLKKGTSVKRYKEELKEIEGRGKIAWKCVDTAVKAFSDCISPNHLKRKKGRPKRNIPHTYIDIEDGEKMTFLNKMPTVNKYLNIQKELNNYGISGLDAQQIKGIEKELNLKKQELKLEKDRDKSNTIKLVISQKNELKSKILFNLLRKLNSYIIEKGLKLSEKEKKELTKKTFTQIAKKLLAKETGISVKSIERRLTEESTHYDNATRWDSLSPPKSKKPLRQKYPLK